MLTLLALAFVCFLVVILYALRKKHHVKATFKIPLAAFFVEFEADDEKQDREKWARENCDRIQARAIRRCGELLRQIKAAKKSARRR